MASKRNIPTLKNITVSPATQVVQKSKTPPSSPPPAISLKDLQEALRVNFLQFKEEIKAELATLKVEIKNEMRAEVKEVIKEENTQLRGDISDAFNGIALNIERIDFNMEDIKQNAGEVENRVEVVEEELLTAQYQQMEFAIRIRGIKEDLNENLKQTVAKDIGLNLGWKAEMIEFEIEKIFRVNSRVARQRNLPRDVVVYFSRKSMRNEIIQAFYQQKFQIAAQDVLILKEIPSKILRRRRNFSFLSDELKRQQIQFRWEIPVGISFTYEGKRYRLFTEAKAKEFYFEILKAKRPSSPQPSQQIQQSELSEIPAAAGASWLMISEQVSSQKSQQDEVKEQRITRAAHKRKEKEYLQKLTEKSEIILTTEPVGGARPKRPMAPDLKVLFQRFQCGPDGQASDLEC